MEGVVKLTLVVHVDGILVSGEKEACEELHHTLNETFPTENLGELKWYLGCAAAQLARGKCNNQTTSNDRYPHQAFQCDRTVMLTTPVKRQTGVPFRVLQ